MADFFKMLETEGGPSQPQWLSDHPNPGNRQLAIQKEIQNWPRENYIADSPAFAKVRQEAKGVKAYSAQEIAEGAKSGQWASFNQKNGATFTPTGATRKSAAPASAGGSAPSGASGANGAPDVSPTTATNASISGSPNTPAVAFESITPSSHMIKANLGPVKIQYPDNWQVKMPEQRGEFVAIAPAAGVTPNGVGYGLLLNGVAAPRGGPMNIDDVTSELVKQMNQNNGLQVLSKAEPITVNGIQGRSVLLESVSPFLNANGQQQKENDWLVTVPQRDGSVIFMVFVAPQTEFSRLEPTYRAMLRSMQVK
jgi:hypothetical protein